jgi:hypothetical protein
VPEICEIAHIPLTKLLTPPDLSTAIAPVENGSDEKQRITMAAYASNSKLGY